MLAVNIISETPFTVRGHGVHTAFLEMVAGLRARRDTNVRVNSLRGADIIHIHTVGLFSLMILLFGRGKKVVTVHIIPDSFVGSLAGAKYWYGLSAWYLGWFYGQADLLVAVSNEVQEALVNQMHIHKPIKVIFNTVDEAEYRTTPEQKQQARDQLGLTADEFMIVGVGQVQPRKRIDSFVRLARELPRFRFTWVGGIPFKQLGADHVAMEQLIKDAPPNFTTTGVIELAEVKPYYQAANAFLLPSNQENHPLAVLEAAASGLPVIIRDIPEYDSSFGQDLIRTDEDGFGVAISKLHDNPAYYRQAVAGSRKVADRFDNKRGADQLMSAYQEILKPKGATA